MILCAVYPSATAPSADRHLRRYRYQQMHVVFQHVPLDDLNVVIPTDLSDQILTRVAASPPSTAFRYFVVHTKCR